MRDLLPPLFQIATGLGTLIFLGATFFVRRVNGPMWARLQLVGLLTMPFGFYMFSEGVAQSTLGRAGNMLAIGGGVMLLGSVFIAVGLVLALRQKQ